MTWDPNRVLARSAFPLGPCPRGVPMLPKLSAAFKLCCIGDSFTVDVSDPVTNSWRYMLYLQLIAAGLSPTFVGNATASGTSPSNLTRAFNGSRLAFHMAGGTYDDPAYIASLSAGSRPDVYVIALGTNDSIAGGTDTTNFGANLVTFVQSQLEPLKSARYLIVKTPKSLGDSTNVNLASIYSQMTSAIATLQGAGILCAAVDCNQLSGTPSYVAAHFDQSFGALAIHPWDPGYLFMASMIFQGVLNATGRFAVWPGDPAEG
jgi:lysophospholipase L1-like esterase